VEEREYSFAEQRGAVRVVVGRAVVGEEVLVARVEEQLRAGRLSELTGPGKGFLRPLVVFHHVNVERAALWPAALELRRRQGGVEKESSLGTRPGLRQRLRRHDAEREAAVHELVREILGCGAPALEDRAEADLTGVRDAVVDRVEGLALKEIGRVDDVARGSKPVRERHDAGG